MKKFVVLLGLLNIAGSACASLEYAQTHAIIRECFKEAQKTYGDNPWCIVCAKRLFIKRMQPACQDSIALSTHFYAHAAVAAGFASDSACGERAAHLSKIYTSLERRLPDAQAIKAFHKAALVATFGCGSESL